MKIIICLFVCLFVGSANATLLLSYAINTTIQGQSNSQNYSTTGFENYKGITLDVHAIGDYGAYEANEYINFNVDGTNFGNYRYDSPSVTSFSPSNNRNQDWDIVFTISISDTEWTNFISDSVLNITWTNSRAVGYTVSNPTHFVSYEVNGTEVTIPEPASLTLLGLGLAGIGFSSKKKMSK